MVRSYLSCTAAILALVGSTQLSAAESQPGGENKMPQNRLFFVSGAEAADASKALAARLADPVQRAKLRQEQRANVEQQHPDLAQELQLDAAVAAKLLDILADQQIERLAERFLRAGSFTFDTQEVADAEDRRLDQLRAILGEQGLERYQDYAATRGQREQVNRMDARLSARDKLQPAQKQQLITLLADAMARDIEAQRLSQGMGLSSSRFGQLLPSQEEMQRLSQLSTIEMNQAILLRRRESNGAIEQSAAAFLTPAQLALLSRIHDESDASLRQWIENARSQVGLERAIPDHAETLTERQPPRVPIAGDLEVELRVVVNRSEPVAISFVVANGQSRLFEAGQGFFIEATPTLYDDDWLQVQLNYYELGTNGQRRRLASGSGFNMKMKTDAGLPVTNTGDTRTMVTGKRAYSIVINARAERA